MDPAGLGGDVARLCRECGMDVVGVADLADVPDSVFASLPRRFDRAVSMALRLHDAVLDGLVDGPTPLYFHMYRQANYALDRAAFSVASFLQAGGFAAVAVPASQIIRRDPSASAEGYGRPRMAGHMSHRRVAERAGLGWIGSSGLLVTERFGARVRLASVLTDAPLEASVGAAGFSCGECRACAEACPAGAIGPTAADFNLRACFEKLDEFAKRPFVGQHICGICVKACRGRESL